MELLDEADVFLTTLLPSVRTKLGIDVEDIHAVNSSVIYARGSAYGPCGPESEKVDTGGMAYWGRTGISDAVTPEGAMQCGRSPAPAFGDVQGAMALAGGIAAALFRRERTGLGCVVDASLLGAGMWAMQPSLVGANMVGADALPKFSHFDPTNPLVEMYRTADQRYIALNMLEADRYWIGLCEVLGQPELAADERFQDMASRRKHAGDCVRALDEIFASRTLAEWTTILQQQEGQWDVVRTVSQLNHDPQASANGYISTIAHGGRTLTAVPAPVQFNEEDHPLSPAPEYAASTEEILLEMNYDRSTIARLKESRVIC